MEYKVTIPNVMYSYYPKYSTLHKANQIFRNSIYSSCTKLNLYIDATNMIYRVYDKSVKKQYATDIVSGIVNLCAHLRDFYRKFYGCETRIFIVYSTCVCRYNRNLYPDYFKMFWRQVNENPRKVEYVKNNNSLLYTLCPYLHDIYYVFTNIEPVMKIYDLIKKEQYAYGREKVPHIIFSKDSYMFSIPARIKDAFVFKLHKNKDPNLEYINICHNGNAVLQYMLENKLGYSNEDVLEELKGISSLLLPYILSITGVRARSIRNFRPLKTAIQILRDFVDFNDPLTMYNVNMDELYDHTPIIYSKLSKPAFEGRWRCIDLIYQAAAYANTPEYRDISYLKNLIDPDSVKMINDKYFKKNPLDLNKL